MSMRVNIRNCLRQVAVMLDKGKIPAAQQDAATMYACSLEELSGNLVKLANGEISLDDFKHFYVLSDDVLHPNGSIPKHS